MDRISNLPFRSRLAVRSLYLIAVGLIFAGTVIAYLHGFTLGIGLGVALQWLLILDLLRRRLTCRHIPAAT